MGAPGFSGPAIPLARWADRQLRLLAAETGAAAHHDLTGQTLLGERGSANGYTINGRISAGIGGSRLMVTRDGGWFALTLLRAEDRELLPALFGRDGFDRFDAEAIAAEARRHDCAALVARGRLLGLPVASADEVPVSPPVELLTEGSRRRRPSGHRPVVIDLSAIWAGPLIGHLLWLVGAEVTKVESLTRPDLIRRDDPATFDLINQGKANVVIDFHDDAQKALLVERIRGADIVIESSRVRALRQLGIDAEALVAEVPGLVWLSVTGHGARGEAADWAGIGNDCGVAAGLARALGDACGEVGYVGDAIADPLTGIVGARAAWRAYSEGRGCRIGLAMSAIAARALTEERALDPQLLDAELRGWGAAVNGPFPTVPRRAMAAPVRAMGADNAAWGLPPC
ncbi:MAG: CoA transferase [Sphingomonadales bacterium]|nr:CoA transferase [Sphingomonadales bacterium]